MPKLRLDFGLDRFCLFFSLVAKVWGVRTGESSDVSSAGGEESRVLEERDLTRLMICAGSPVIGS